MVAESGKVAESGRVAESGKAAESGKLVESDMLEVLASVCRRQASCRVVRMPGYGTLELCKA